MNSIVLLMDDSELSRIVFHALHSAFPIAAVVREAKLDRKTFLKRRLKKLGWATVLGQIAFMQCIVPRLKRQAAERRQQILKDHNLNDSPIAFTPLMDVPSINDPRVIDILKQLGPSVVVVNGTRILGEEVLQCIDAVFLNTHVGITPLYRGVHGGYWALASNDAKNFGVTIHKIDKGIDTGAIVAQALTQPEKADNFTTYPLLQISAALPALKDAICAALSGSLEAIPTPPGKSRLWSHPTAFEYIKNRIGKNIR